jgi:putative DNA primase/helicase
MSDMDFITAMRAVGLSPPDFIEPGKLHRFPGEGKRTSNRAGWCRLFDDRQGGVYGDWSTGLAGHWQAERDKPLTAAEREAFKRKVAEARKQADAERQAKRAEAAAEAAAIWEAATPAPADHPYLTRKRISAHDLRVHDNRLVVPLRDAGGNLRSLQFIAGDGGKKYLPGGAIKGNSWVIGNLTAETPYIYIVEGVATAATIHAAMQGCTVAAMSAGNLKPVAEALHSRYPGARIILCADDDLTEGNPGVTAAGAAAKAVGGIVVVPQFPAPRDAKLTDFNDLAVSAGVKTVRQQIEDMLATVDSFEAPPDGADQNQSASADNAIIAELAALSPLQYDRRRKKYSDQMGVRATTLDKMVAERREKIAAAAEVDGVVEELTAWETPVDGRELAERIARTLATHVIMPEGACTAVTLFTIGTFCMDAWHTWPKLLITSPEKRCGKTRLLETVEAMTHRSLLTSNITASSLFRCIAAWSPTLLVDEADTFAKDNEELNGIINAGHTRRTASIIRSEKVGDSFEPRKFSVWCPQVIAGIKSQRDTLHDRSVHIQMRRKMPGESVQKIPRDLFEKLRPLRRQAMRWAQDNVATLKASRPDVPSLGNDRAQDNWEPLFAIAELIGGIWPDRVLMAYDVIEGASGDDDNIGPALLNDIKVIFNDRGRDHIFSAELVDALVDLEEAPWGEWRRGKPMTKNTLAKLLRPYGVVSGTVRIGATTAKGYTRTRFEDAWNRYCSDTPETNVTSSQSSSGAGFSPISKRNTEGGVTVQKPLKPNNGAGCDDVTFENGVYGTVGGFEEEF